MDAQLGECSNLTPCRASARLRTGVAFFAVALGLTVAMTQLQWAQPFRWLLVVPFFMACSSVTQGLYGACAMRAMLGQREDANGPEQIADPEMRQAARDRSLRAMLHGAVVAAALTAVVVVLA